MHLEQLMVYTRAWKSFPEQLELLKSRGMVVTDEASALDYLERVGYYRLSGYWFPCRQRSGPQSLFVDYSVTAWLH